MQPEDIYREPNPAVRHIILHISGRLKSDTPVDVLVQFNTLERHENSEWTAALNNNAPYQRLQDWAEKQKLSVVYNGKTEYRITTPASTNP